ncbi:MAG: hypothetical protein LBP74_04450 [Treponema sp.]|nr:hypothetical protein [Treponema sp.]
MGKAAFSYEPDTPDKLIKNLPRDIKRLQTQDPEEFIRQLAAYILANSANKFDRVKKAHDWVALNIQYNAESYWSNTIPGQDYLDVLKTGMAVCAGYANVFKAVCDEMGIKTEIVSGYGRGVSFSVFGDEPVRTNHDWNMVEIEGSWYLLDCTWDSGYMNGRKNVRKYTTNYLFLKPEQMIYTHYPENPEVQLLNEPVSVEEFIRLPAYRPLFFNSIVNIKPDFEKINVVEDKIDMEFTVKDNVYLLFQVLDGEGIKETGNTGPVYREGNTYKVLFSFPVPGNYIIRCFSSRQLYGKYDWCVDYGIISMVGSRFPPS